MSRLQAQLNSLKAFKLGRINTGTSKGLIDSGATHPLRPAKMENEEENLKEVEVSLADGKSVRLHMVTSSQDIEPIGMMIEMLGRV